LFRANPNLAGNCKQRTPLCEVASVSQRDGGRFARHDTLASDAGNLPLDETKKTFKGQGRSSARSIKGAVGCCWHNTYHSVLFCRVSPGFLNLSRALFFRRIYAPFDLAKLI
jgi:hypothetical protein